NPRPVAALACGSMSIRSTRVPASATHAVMLIAVVVLPTPPFWLASAYTRELMLRTMVPAEADAHEQSRDGEETARGSARPSAGTQVAAQARRRGPPRRCPERAPRSPPAHRRRPGRPFRGSPHRPAPPAGARAPRRP